MAPLFWTLLVVRQRACSTVMLMYEEKISALAAYIYKEKIIDQPSYYDNGL